MSKKIEIGQAGKVRIKWNVRQTDYTKEQERSLIAEMAEKYQIPVRNITVEVNYITESDGCALSSDTVRNIHDPRFQQELMRQYIAANGITDVDFDEIVRIDSRINSLIDYDAYDKGRKYTVKWMRWSNFLSYGPDNYFDFTTLRGLVLLNGEPANKSGKSTFAYDLLHFLLFGKTNTNKAKTMSELFNNYIPDAKTLSVEGCIEIDGEDYIIRRTLSRSLTGKRKNVTNKVEYFRLMADGTEEAVPDENLQGESSAVTSRIIKDAIGNESDFDLIISANAKDLDNLISLTETEKGRLLSRWIGLSIIEDKDVRAREKWNREVSVGRYSDMYNQADLKSEIETMSESVESGCKEIERLRGVIDSEEKAIAEQNGMRDALLSSKQAVDDGLLRVDVHTLESRIKEIVETGKRKKAEIAAIETEIKEMGDVTFSEDDYKAMLRESERTVSEISSMKSTNKHLEKTNSALSSAEFCPTCHRRLDNVDNSSEIAKNKAAIEENVRKIETMEKSLSGIRMRMAEVEEKRAAYRKKTQMELKKSALESEVSLSRAEYVEKKTLYDNIQKNKDAIRRNNEIDTKVNLANANIRAHEKIRNDSVNMISSIERDNVRYRESIAQKKGFIVKIEEERKEERYWKLYLQMIGKDGISKMVLRNTLPIINNELNKMLDDVTDFRVEIVMNEKNDVDFLLIRDEVVTRLSAASGLEKTQAALALRVVLGNMSNLSRPPFILLDEVLGTVAKENYDDMHRLYSKITEYFNFVLHITHLSEIADWHDSIVTVQKVNNISKIKSNQ